MRATPSGWRPPRVEGRRLLDNTLDRFIPPAGYSRHTWGERGEIEWIARDPLGALCRLREAGCQVVEHLDESITVFAPSLLGSATGEGHSKVESSEPSECFLSLAGDYPKQSPAPSACHDRSVLLFSGASLKQSNRQARIACG